jgi:hypothetical protein
MHPILRNVLAVITGLVIGSAVNMALVYLGPVLIPLPDGADVTTPEGLAASIALFQPQHFLFPFLAHALGTLSGAWLAVTLGASRYQLLAGIISGFFLLGGIANVAMIGGPLWFNALDLTMAYLPMGWLALRLAGK